MEKSLKILYFIDRMGRGGIQTFVFNLVSKFDKDKIKIDFLLLDDGNYYDLEEELIEKGYNVFKLNNIWVNKVSDFFKLNNALKKFFHEHHDYDIIHLHSSSKNYLVLKYAQKYGIPIRIAHSHNTDFQTNNALKKLVGNFMKLKLKRYATDYFACSPLAGEWLFGKKNVKNGKVKIVYNAIDYEKFAYNKNLREEIRKKLNISKNTKVIGNVARFANQKNHNFLIEIFYEYQKLEQNSILLLVGTGPLEDKIKSKVLQLGIEDKVIFAGLQKNVNEFLQAMDYFVFPSLYEGLGIVLIEAQANGLKCFTSKDVVPKIAKVTPLLKFISLKETSTTWAKIIQKENNKRVDYYNEFKKRNYILDDIVLELEKTYFNLYSEYCKKEIGDLHNV